MPLQDRSFEIKEKDRGKKWVVSCKAKDFDLLSQIIMSNVIDREFSVIYWDNIQLLTRLQNILEQKGHKTTILHSQMPNEIREENLTNLNNASIGLVTSMAEVGIEFEEYGRSVDNMISVNTSSVSKAIQRWGRLARREKRAGTMFLIDLPWVRKSITSLFNNGLQYSAGYTAYPSFISEAIKHKDTFFVGYRSQKADIEFHETLKRQIEKITGQVSKIYLSAGQEIKSAENDDERLNLSLNTISTGAIQITHEHYLEVINRDKELYFFVNRGQLKSRKPLVNFTIREAKHIDMIKLPSMLNPKLKQMGFVQATLSDAEIDVFLPQIGKKDSLKSELIKLQIEKDIMVGPDFYFDPLYDTLLEFFEPASIDLGFFAFKKENTKYVCLFEPANINDSSPVGVNEYCWHIVKDRDELGAKQ
jgi:hypothetical protein